MHKKSRNQRVSLFSKSLLYAVGVAALATPLTPSFAQSDARQQISIDAQPLDLALVEIGRRYGVSITAPSDMTRGKSAPRVSGNLTAEQAMARVLRGSGLSYRRNPTGSYSLAQVSTVGAQRTPEAISRAKALPEATSETIVVVGTKLKGDIQDVDTSIEVFDEDRIDREEIVDLSDILLRTPNVSTGSGLGNDFSIRGIGRRGATGAGTGISSNVYVDGAPISPLALLRGPLTLWDTGQIEVLRGPQSTVQGRNALAGAIVVSTNDPTYEYEGKVRATYGRFDEVQLAGALSGPIVEDQVAARIAVDYQSFDGFITNVPANLAANARDSVLIRGKILIEPEALPGFSTKFTIDYADATSGDPSPRIQSDIDADDPAFQDFDFFDFETFGPFIQNQTESLRIVNETVIDVAKNWLIRGIFTFEETDAIRSFDLLDDEPLGDDFTRNAFQNEIFSAEARAEFDYDNLRGFLGGYYYEEDATNQNRAQTNFASLAALSPVPITFAPLDSVAVSESNGRSGIDNFAIFGQAEWDLDDNWRVNLGFRYDNEQVTAIDNPFAFIVSPETCSANVPGSLINPNLPPFPFVAAPCQLLLDAFFSNSFGTNPGEGEEFSTRFEAFLPRAAVTYRFDEESSVFLSYQRGYRAGGARFVLAPTATAGINATVLNEFDPEFLDTFEIGTRNVFLDGKLVANANVFYSLYSDQQTSVLGPIPQINGIDDLIINAAESTLYGAEFSLDYTVNDNWNFFASVGLLETEFDDFPFAVDENGDPQNPGNPQFANLAGDEFPFAPNVTFTFTGNYQHGSGFYASSTFTYTGPQFTGIPNLTNEDFEQAFLDNGGDAAFGATLTEEVESRSDLTLRVGYRTGNFNVFAAATNVLDDDQLRSRNFGVVSTTTGDVNLAGGVQGLVFQPRSFRLGVDVSF